ncbi:soluble calcium-activated nucleotidase 1-like isoform X2 [Paramacrobiotus metropolitanus]|uniref:soluble calcium-activated nucleotidase 1-like isoform X2 n=1 Tax=Paramacrobiotus metropolitanus TaxID=2943436 RepID=UPI00244616CF|nr:soluble calcium-activated nucleotidase 1-like isoform X2 [Paramacrobiotus metropolitanus]
MAYLRHRLRLLIILEIFYLGLAASAPLTNRPYNITYPLTEPVIKDDGSVEYKLAIISDQDMLSKHTTGASTWLSYLKMGKLIIRADWTQADIVWDASKPNNTQAEHTVASDTFSGAGQIILSQFAFGNRGMELSDIVVFDGRLFACEDRTGIIFEIVDNQVVPWVILADGNGRKQKGFKCEWSIVKDEHLFVGSHSADIKIPNPGGPSVEANQRWVKKVSKDGFVEHLDWNTQYAAIEKELGIKPPGYIMHEAVLWSQIRQHWHFLPRQISPENFTEERHPYTCSNVMLSINADYTQFQKLNIGEHNPLYGFSAARFVPGTDDNVIVALRIMEVGDTFTTRIIVFTINGNILMEEELVLDGLKYEGIEFV